jgi:hypothetical protein
MTVAEEPLYSDFIRSTMALHCLPRLGAAVAPSSNQHSRIIQLVDFEVRRDHNYIAMVLEAGDIDLAKVLAQKNGIKNSSSTGAGTIGECASMLLVVSATWARFTLHHGQYFKHDILVVTCYF